MDSWARLEKAIEDGTYEGKRLAWAKWAVAMWKYGYYSAQAKQAREEFVLA